MTCREVELLLGAYLDGELDPVHSLDVEAHWRDCPACAAALESHQRLSVAVAAADYYPASPALRARLERKTARLWQRPAPWMALVAGLAVAAVVIGKLAPSSPLEKEVVQAHLLSMQTGHLVDVPASGHHTVKPWFGAKLDFAVDVEDIPARGFVPAGGRLDYLNGRAVAALVYQRGSHLINVFVWPAGHQPDQQPESRAWETFNLVNWRADGMNWWAVSDLSLNELEELPLCPCFMPVHEALRS